MPTRLASVQNGYFTTRLPADDHLWTAGFFNERFPDVVSPLGWSVVQWLVEQTAFVEPLSFIGYRLPADFPLTKLYCGHVYANVGIFQRLYRVFPEALLPQYAGRYFPGGDTSLRYAVPPPSPGRFCLSIAHTLLSEPGWHPFNYVTWRRFVPWFDKCVADCLRQIEADGRPATLLVRIGCLMDASLRLLRLHRWSLTYADVLYDLLQRLVAMWVDAGTAHEISADLVSGLPNKSTETDVALWHLAEQAGRLDATLLDHLRAGHFEVFIEALQATPTGRRFQQALHDFLEHYGHRSPSLDLWYPAYRDEVNALLALIARLVDAEGEGPLVRERAREQRRTSTLRRLRRQWGAFSIRWLIFRVLLWFAQRYTILREDQRFYWQKSLHAKRRAFLRIGQALAADGVLAAPDDIFFLTLNEVQGVVQGWLRVPEIQTLVMHRRAEFQALRGADYPAFLRGRSPLHERACARERGPRRLMGLAASPGRVHGPALVVRGPAALEEAWRRASPGNILVTGSTDPGWTPLFLRVAGLVMERGGQLSHGAVVAREYGLPAVVGVAGVLEYIKDGQMIEVDGSTGTVVILAGPAKPFADEIGEPSEELNVPRRHCSRTGTSTGSPPGSTSDPR